MRKFDLRAGKAKKKPRTRKLKMFVWEDVFTDYYSGMLVALAYDVEHARAVAKKKLEDSPGMKTAFVELAVDPSVVTKPAAFFVAGGG